MLISLDALVMISAIIFAFFILATFIYSMHRRNNLSRRSTASNAHWILMSILALSVLCYSLALSYSDLTVTKAPVSQALLLTLETFTFALDVPAAEPAPTLQKAGIHLPDWLFYGLGNILYFAASLTTLTTIIQLVSKRLTLHTLFLTTMWRETYVFSNVNESAIALAESIRKEHLLRRTCKLGKWSFISPIHPSPVCQIIFADANLENDRLLEEVMSRGFKYMDTVPDAIVARCRCRGRSHLHIILSSPDEAENIHEGLNLASRLNQRITRDLIQQPLRTQSTLHVFASSSAAENFIDRMVRKTKADPEEPYGKITGLLPQQLLCHIPARHIVPDCIPEIRRVDWMRSVVQQILVDYPLFITSKLPDGKDEDASRRLTQRLYTDRYRRIVIVGCGNMGYEFLKGALWCSQSLAATTHIDVIDLNAKDVEKRLMADAPEVLADSEEAIPCRFLPMDVKSAEYVTYLKKPSEYNEPDGHENGPTDITYMLFALGKDLLNTEVAKRTRETLEACRMVDGITNQPFMAVVIDDRELSESVREIENSNSQSYDLVPVGDESVMFSYENMFSPSLERMAKRLNFSYLDGYKPPSTKPKTEKDRRKFEEERAKQKRDADNGYNKYEYNRRSSRAAAVFLKYDLYEFCRLCLDTKDLSIDDLPDIKAWARKTTDADKSPTTVQEPISDESFNMALRKYEELVADNEYGRMSLELMRLEHRRWDAYMRTEGFSVCEKSTYKRVYHEARRNQHQLARLHFCLVPFDTLPDVDTWYAMTLAEDMDQKLFRESLTELESRIAEDKCEPDVTEAFRSEIAQARSAVTKEKATGDALEWFRSLSDGRDATRKTYEHALDWLFRRFIDQQLNEDSILTIRREMTDIARHKTLADRRDKPFQHNDLVIIRDLTKILRGDHEPKCDR